jgi:hypothetical protein
MGKYNIIYRKRNRFIGGELQLGVTYSPSSPNDHLNFISFFNKARITSRRKRNKFKAASDYITFGEWCRRRNLRLTSNVYSLLKVYLNNADQVWISDA